MNFRRPFFRVFAILLAVQATGLLSCADLLTEARDRLANGEREAAAALFQRHLDSTAPSAAIYYELGQLQDSADKSADAALAYSRALLLDPAFTPAREALQAANRDLGIPTPPLDWRDKVAAAVPADVLTAVGALAFWAGAFLLRAPLLWNKKHGRVTGGFLLVLGSASVLLSWTTDPRILDAREVMILHATGAPLQRTPTEDPSGKITTLAPGTLITVLGTSGRWFHGQLPGGQQGWFLQESAKPLLPAPPQTPNSPR
jgi:hypothetical protein